MTRSNSEDLPDNCGVRRVEQEPQITKEVRMFSDLISRCQPPSGYMEVALIVAAGVGLIAGFFRKR